MGRAVAPVVSDFFYLDAHARRGVTTRLNAEVVALTGRDTRVQWVELSDGSSLPADLVIIGIGVVPRTELAHQLDLVCDGGIVVDRFARTSNPNVVSAGDCTVQPDWRTGSGKVRLESVQNAINQAKAAASTLAGGVESELPVPCSGPISSISSFRSPACGRDTTTTWFAAFLNVSHSPCSITMTTI